MSTSFADTNIHLGRGNVTGDAAVCPNDCECLVGSDFLRNCKLVLVLTVSAEFPVVVKKVSVNDAC